jgi:hypothetical protein
MSGESKARVASCAPGEVRLKCYCDRLDELWEAYGWDKFLGGERIVALVQSDVLVT